MNVTTRVKFTMAVRVRDFLVAHPFGAGPAAEVAARFAEKVSRAQALFAQQEQGVAASMASSQHRRGLRRRLNQVPLRHLRKIAKAAAAEHPEITLGVRKPLGRSEAAFQAGLRAIQAEAATHKETLLTYGLSEESLAELTELLAAFEQAVAEANAGLRAHTGARAELESLVRELMQLIQHLDGIVSYQFRDQPELMGAWKSARNVAWPLNEPAKSGEGTGKQSAA